MTDPTPKQTVNEIIRFGEANALQTFDGMSDEECLLMVRDFCGVMAEWQPYIASLADDPMLLGVSCLSTAELFKRAFARAYLYINKKVDAMDAIDKAFGVKK